MNGLIRGIKRLFGKYEPGYEYWVKLSDIKLPNYLKHSRIGEEKYKRKWKYFRETGELESKIILDKDFVLRDGYSSYIIAKKAGIDKVGVYFKF